MKGLGVWLLALLWLGAAGAAPIDEGAADKSARAKKFYEEGHFEEALQLYRQAQVEAPEEKSLNYNAGSALFKTGDYAGAAAEFDAATAGGDEGLKARAFYNLGNAHFQQQQYQQAVDAYRQALEHDWQDQEAKANLELALAKQQEQQQQQSQQGQEQDRQSQQGQQQGQQQRPQQRPQQDQQQQPQPQQGQQQEQQRGQEQDQQQQQQHQGQGRNQRTGQRNRMDREEAEQLLDAMRDREKQAQQRRQRGTQAYRGKDW